MRTGSAIARVTCAAVVFSAFAGATAHACMDYRPMPTGLAADVLSDDPAVASAAISKLRAMGPEGLGVLMYVYAPEIRRLTGDRKVAYPLATPEAFESACPQDVPAPGLPRSAYTAPGIAERGKRLIAAIDAVAAQKDAAHSGLYWYTDIDQAKAAAKQSGKPILSLRLLGKLDTEFSCANSRFFRTVLYANEEVSAALRDRFVLHWQSVRPVPKVTIDMGDGRVIERTITGNSVHYVLDSDGRPVDAIPGLYGPKAFLRAIGDAAQVAAATQKATDPAARQAVLKDWHAERAVRLTQQWEQDFAAVAPAQVQAPVPGARPLGNTVPTALQATPIAPSKAVVELNIVRALAPRVATLKASTTDEAWAKIAALPAHAVDGRLDEGSIALVRAKFPAARDAGRLSVAKMRQEDPVGRLVANLQRSVAEDTVRNEYAFHRTVHEWFANRLPETTAAEVTALNEKVYAELFLTPSSDPWLGLVPADTYSALEGDGVKIAAK